MQTIVLAEDSRTVRKMVQIALDKAPYTVTEATDGQKALAAVRQSRPAAALVDSALNGIDGYELCRQIKADGATRDVRVILLTGPNTPYDEGRGQQCGVDGVVEKPFRTQELIDTVARALTGQVPPEGALFRQQLESIPLASGGQATRSVAAGPPPAAAPSRPAPPPPPSRPAAQANGHAAPPPAAAPAPTPPPAPAPPPAAPAASAAVSGAVQAAADKVQSNPDLAGALQGTSREVIERIVWEVVPPLAEAILREEIAKLVRERMSLNA